MLVHLRPFTEHELSFIQSRGIDFGKGCARLRKGDAAKAFADGWSIVEGGLSAKGIMQNQAQKAARIFFDAAWTEWYQNKSIWRRLMTTIGLGMAFGGFMMTVIIGSRIPSI